MTGSSSFSPNPPIRSVAADGTPQSAAYPKPTLPSTDQTPDQKPVQLSAEAQQLNNILTCLMLGVLIFIIGIVLLVVLSTIGQLF